MQCHYFQGARYSEGPVQQCQNQAIHKIVFELDSGVLQNLRRHLKGKQQLSFGFEGSARRAETVAVGLSARIHAQTHTDIKGKQ